MVIVVFFSFLPLFSNVLCVGNTCTRLGTCECALFDPVFYKHAKEWTVRVVQGSVLCVLTAFSRALVSGIYSLYVSGAAILTLFRSVFDPLNVFQRPDFEHFSFLSNC